MASIALALDRWDPARGGAERAFDQLARHLVRRGHEVVVCCERAATPAVPRAPGEPRIVRVEGPRLPRALAPGRYEEQLGIRLVRAAEREGADLLVGLRHLPRADLLWPHGGSHAATVAARRRARGLAPEVALRGRHRRFDRLERALLAGAARRVVCVSERVREEFLALDPTCASRLTVLPNGIDRERFHPRERVASGRTLRAALGFPGDGAPLLAFVAREPELKGLPLLFEALRELSGSPWRLVVAGTRDPGPWRRRAAACGLPAERLAFESELDPAALFAAADLLVHPTWRDTAGLVLLEALSSGLPVVTTDAAGEAELCRSGAFGAVVAAGQVSPLARALEGWLAQLQGGSFDRELARAATADREILPWLERMEAELLAL